MDESTTFGTTDWLHEEIHREHRLISERMSWYVASQAFLMGAFAMAGRDDHPYKWLPPTTAVVGLAMTLVAAISLGAALFSMRILRGQLFSALDDADRKRLSYWFSTQRRWLHWAGAIAPVFMPAIFLVLWAVMLTQSLPEGFRLSGALACQTAVPPERAGTPAPMPSAAVPSMPVTNPSGSADQPPAP